MDTCVFSRMVVDEDFDLNDICHLESLHNREKRHSGINSVPTLNGRMFIDESDPAQLQSHKSGKITNQHNGTTLPCK